MTLTNGLSNPNLLTDRSIIACNGSDAKTFLQGQITNDINLLGDQACIHTLILTPQGKILADMFIFNASDGYYIDIHRSAAAWLVKRFNMYKLRSDVAFKDVSETLNVGFNNADNADVLVSAQDPRPAFPSSKEIYRYIFKAVDQLHDASGILAYSNAGFALATFGVDYQASEFFPQDLWFDKLGSVSYTKGCYVGQEVVSRMRHKSTARKRLLPFQGSHALGKGNPILLNEKTVGTVISQHQLANHYVTLAIMRMDKLNDDETEFLDIEGNTLNLTKPKWMQNL